MPVLTNGSHAKPADGSVTSTTEAEVRSVEAWGWRLEQTSSDSPLSLSKITLSPNLDDLALGYFFSKYVFPSAKSPGACNIEVGNGCLAASIKALGTAGVTGCGRASSCTQEARHRYMNAVQLTNSALQCPTDAKHDSTLLAINLLGMFETLVGQSLGDWHNHIQGGAALLQFRGPEQFETDTGGRLFLHTIATLVISCVHQRMPVPKHIHQLQVLAEKLIPDPHDQIWRYHKMNIHFADLFAKLLPGNILRSPDDAEAIIQEALAIDAEIVGLLNGPDPDWRYDVVLANGPFIYAGYYYVFRHILFLQMCTGCFSNRIILHDMIIKAVAATEDLSTLNLSHTQLEYLIIRQHQLDIFASVPQQLGPPFSQCDFKPLVGSLHDGTSTRRNILRDYSPWRSRKSGDADLPLVRRSGGCILQWAIRIAGAADVPGGDERNWAIVVLKNIVQTMGLQQAMIHAKSLEENTGNFYNAHKIVFMF